MSILKHIGRGPKSAIAQALAAGSLVIGDLVVTTGANGNELILIERDGSQIVIKSRTQADFDLLGTTVPAGSDLEQVLEILAAKFDEKIGTVPAGKTVMGIIGEIQENAYDDTEIREAIEGVQDNVDALAAKVGTVADDTTVVDMIAAAESAAKSHADEKVAAEVTARNEAIATAKGEATAYADQKVAAEVTARDAAIATAKGEATAYTDEKIAAEVEARNSAIAAAVANADHLKRSIVDELPAELDQNTIYMVAIVDGAGNQKYEEFMVVNGQVEKIGDSAVDLTDYALKSEVQAAEGAAKSYADEKVAAEVTARDAAIAAAVADEVTARDAAIATAKGEATAYTDEKVGAEATARGTAITEAINAEVTARDAAIATAKGEATAYADQKVAAEVTARDAAIATAKGEANTYADEKVAAEVTARNSAIATAKGEANSYTDQKVSGEVAARNEAIATAKGEANTYADGKASEALTQAKAYTDEKVGAEVTARDAAIEAAIEAEVTARDAAIAAAIEAAAITWVDFGA